MTITNVQSSYTTYPPAFRVGTPLRHVDKNPQFDNGAIYVADNALHRPHAGDPVYWDAANGQFRVPGSALDAQRIVGILVRNNISWDSSEYNNGDRVQIMQSGAIGLLAGGSVNYRNCLAYDVSTNKWVAQPPVAVEAPEDLTGTTATDINAYLATLTANINAALRSLHYLQVISVDHKTIMDDNPFEARIRF